MTDYSKQAGLNGKINNWVRQLVYLSGIYPIESIENLKFWINSIKTNLGEKNIIIPIIIVGNKLDKEDMRDITREEAEKFAKENKYKYFETSAKTGEGVDDAIRDLVNQVLEKSEQFEEERNERKSIKINSDQPEDNVKKKGCC